MHPIPRRFLALALCCAPVAAQAQVFVRADAPAGGDGSSWASAYQRLDTALAAHPGDEIWVARGRYVPPVNPNPDYTPSEQRRRTSFLIPPGTRIYGGFAGSESALAQRNPRLHRSVLSGDMQANDSNRDADGVTPTPDSRSAPHALASP